MTLKEAIQFLKNHYGKIFAGTTGTLIFTVGGFWFSDIRYVKASEYKKQQVEIQQQIELVRKEIRELNKQ